MRIPYEQRVEVNDFLELSLLKEYNVFAVTFYHGGAWLVRCSAQIFNDVSVFPLSFIRVLNSAQLDDFEKLGAAWLQVSKEMTQEHEAGNL